MQMVVQVQAASPVTPGLTLSKFAQSAAEYPKLIMNSSMHETHAVKSLPVFEKA